MRHLSLRENNFHDVVGIALQEACRQNQTILTLQLNRNPIGLRYLEQISLYLQRNQQLQRQSVIPGFQKAQNDLLQYVRHQEDPKREMFENQKRLYTIARELERVEEEARAKEELQVARTREAEERLQDVREESAQLDREIAQRWAQMEEEYSMRKIAIQAQHNALESEKSELQRLE